MDDKETLRENLKAIYRSLPEQVKTAIFSPETSDAYDRVKARYLLNDEQRETISVQSGLLMMGLRLPQELVTALTEGLNIPREKASLIAQELNRDIFNAIRDDLKKIHQVEQSAAVAPSTPVSTPPTPVTPPKPTEPIYPAFLQQIQESTPPYVSGTFPSATPKQPKGGVETPLAPSSVVTTSNAPKTVPAIPVSSVQPIPPTVNPINVPLQAPATPVIPPLPQPQVVKTVAPSAPITPPQMVTPGAAPVLPVTPAATITPTKSLEEIQASIQNPPAPQVIQAAFQGKAAEMDSSKLPGAGSPFAQQEIILNPTRAIPPQEISTPKPVETMPMQPTMHFVAAPVIPVAPAQPVSLPIVEAPVQAVVSQPTPPPASIFEQKMSGAFTIKSALPDYSAPIVVPTAPQPQTPATFQMPQPMNPVATPQGDAYREPTV